VCHAYQVITSRYVVTQKEKPVLASLWYHTNVFTNMCSCQALSIPLNYLETLSPTWIIPKTAAGMDTKNGKGAIKLATGR